MEVYNFDGHFYDNGKQYVKIFKHKNKPKLKKINKKIYEKQLEIYNKFIQKCYMKLLELLMHLEWIRKN
jgi:hypothetical protein